MRTTWHRQVAPALRHNPLVDMRSCCRTMGLRRSIAVELKSVATDVGRQRLVDLMQWVFPLCWRLSLL